MTQQEMSACILSLWRHPCSPYRSGCFSISTISFSSPTVTATSQQKTTWYHLMREETRYSSWDVPIQGTTLKKALLSWSGGRHQSWKIGQQCFSTSMWVYIENNRGGWFDMHRMTHSVSEKVCFWHRMWFVELESWFCLLETSLRFSLPVAMLNSSRPGCRLSLSEESCPLWLVDELVALLHTICAPIIKWLA